MFSREILRRQSLISECSIPVVRLLWEQVDWVRFPALRQLSIKGNRTECHGGILRGYRLGDRFPALRQYLNKKSPNLGDFLKPYFKFY